MNLERTAGSLLEQFPAGADANLERQEKALERFGNIAFTGFGIVIGVAVLTIIYLIAAKMIFSGEQPFAGVVLVAFILFAALSLGYVIWREALNEKRAQLEKSRSKDPNLQHHSPAHELPPTSFEPSSVVEDTTELLETRRRTKTLEE